MFLILLLCAGQWRAKASCRPRKRRVSGSFSGYEKNLLSPNPPPPPPPEMSLRQYDISPSTFCGTRSRRRRAAHSRRRTRMYGVSPRAAASSPSTAPKCAAAFLASGLPRARLRWPPNKNGTYFFASNYLPIQSWRHIYTPGFTPSCSFLLVYFFASDYLPIQVGVHAKPEPTSHRRPKRPHLI